MTAPRRQSGGLRAWVEREAARVRSARKAIDNIEEHARIGARRAAVRRADAIEAELEAQRVKDVRDWMRARGIQSSFWRRMLEHRSALRLGSRARKGDRKQ